MAETTTRPVRVPDAERPEGAEGLTTIHYLRREVDDSSVDTWSVETDEWLNGVHGRDGLVWWRWSPPETLEEAADQLAAALAHYESEALMSGSQSSVVLLALAAVASKSRALLAAVREMDQ